VSGAIAPDCIVHAVTVVLYGATCCTGRVVTDRMGDDGLTRELDAETNGV